jgi:hypothetical protein
MTDAAADLGAAIAELEMHVENLIAQNEALQARPSVDPGVVAEQASKVRRVSELIRATLGDSQ